MVAKRVPIVALVMVEDAAVVVVKEVVAVKLFWPVKTLLLAR